MQAGEGRDAIDGLGGVMRGAGGKKPVEEYAVVAI